MASDPVAMGTDQPMEERCHAPQPVSRSARRRRRRKLQQRFLSIGDGISGAQNHSNAVAIENQPLLYTATNASDGALPSMLTVSEQIDPWVEWTAHRSAYPMRLYGTKVRIHVNGSPTAVAVVNMYTPMYLSALVLAPLDIGLDTETPVKMSFNGCRKISRVTLDRINALRKITSVYLSATVPKYMQQEKDYMILLRPDQPHDKLRTWLDRTDVGSYKRCMNIVGEFSWTHFCEKVNYIQTNTDSHIARGKHTQSLYTDTFPYTPNETGGGKALQHSSTRRRLFEHRACAACHHNTIH
jgi:hypothetical protein